MAELAIVIPNRNTRELLRACLDALRRHPPTATLEVVVVDNASSDGSADMVRAQFPSVRVIENLHNAWFARACNQGIAATEGEFVLLLNSDAFVHDGSLDMLLGFMRAHPDAGVCGPQLFNADGSRQKSTLVLPTPLNSVFFALGLSRLVKRLDEARCAGPTQVEVVSGACLFVRRRVVEMVGRLDESYGFYTEEVDFCARAARGGWGVFFLPSSRVTHLFGQSSTNMPDEQQLMLINQGRLHFLRDRYPRSCVMLTRACVQAAGFAKTLMWGAWRVVAPTRRGFAARKARANWRLATWRTVPLS